MERKKLLILLITIFIFIGVIIMIVLINNAGKTKNTDNNVITQNSNLITAFPDKKNEIVLDIRQEKSENGIKFYDQFNEEIKQF